MYRNFISLFTLSSAISCHLLSKTHLGVKKGWFANKWFWAGLFGNLPALIAFLGHIFLLKEK
ncbi:MAG: hypothetical protein U9N06_05775 [candidate division WOR-3 bacterium]|nr:hypothetical protein [candidate division WOR-3 bacterium]